MQDSNPAESRWTYGSNATNRAPLRSDGAFYGGVLLADGGEEIEGAEFLPAIEAAGRAARDLLDEDHPQAGHDTQGGLRALSDDLSAAYADGYLGGVERVQPDGGQDDHTDTEAAMHLLADARLRVKQATETDALTHDEAVMLGAVEAELQRLVELLGERVQADGAGVLVCPGCKATFDNSEDGRQGLQAHACDPEGDR